MASPGPAACHFTMEILHGAMKVRLSRCPSSIIEFLGVILQLKSVKEK